MNKPTTKSSPIVLLILTFPYSSTVQNHHFDYKFLNLQLSANIVKIII
jgi:hypothetical protein